MDTIKIYELPNLGYQASSSIIMEFDGLTYRTPLSTYYTHVEVHADTHVIGGSDPIAIEDIGGVPIDDIRLTNSRTPTSHKSSHAIGGSDVLTPADIGADISGSAQAAQNMAVQRANHTGTQTQSTIVNLVSDLADKQSLNSNLTAYGAAVTNLDRRNLFDGAGNGDLVKYDTILRPVASGAPTSSPSVPTIARVGQTLRYGDDPYTWYRAKDMNVWEVSSAGLLNFTESLSSLAPNITIPVVSLKPNNAASNVDISIVPKGTGGIFASVPDSLSSGGNKRGIYSIDLQFSRTSPLHVAAAPYSVLIGGKNNSLDYLYGSNSVCIGGNGNSNNATDAFMGGGIGNTSDPTAYYSACVGGSGNINNKAGSFCGGGDNNRTIGNRSSCVGGISLTASAADSSCVGGLSNRCDGQYSVCVGGNRNYAGGLNSVVTGSYGTDRSINNLRVHSCGSQVGNAQKAIYPLTYTTSNSTPTELSTNGGIAGNTSRPVLGTHTAWAFTGQIVARRVTSSISDVKTWWIRGGIKRGATAADTYIVGTTSITSDGDVATSGWTIDVSADTTNGSLKVLVTGGAFSVRWSGYIETAEAGA